MEVGSPFTGKTKVAIAECVRRNCSSRIKDMAFCGLDGHPLVKLGRYWYLDTTKDIQSGPLPNKHTNQEVIFPINYCPCIGASFSGVLCFEGCLFPSINLEIDTQPFLNKKVWDQVTSLALRISMETQ